jgi:RecA/RadA recombinase
MVKKEEKEGKKNLGKLSIAEIQKLINKQAAGTVSFNLKDDDPASVVDWIPTGADWLDCIICKGKRAGIPVGRVSELAGESACVTEDTEIEVEISD